MRDRDEPDADARHHPSCEGHVDCPRCGRETCARPVVWCGDGRVDTVLCLSCWRTFGLLDEPGGRP